LCEVLKKKSGILWFILLHSWNFRYVASDGKTIGEQRIEKSLEGSDIGLTAVLSHHLPGGTEKNQITRQ
jgi:hypothetical protein